MIIFRNKNQHLTKWLGFLFAKCAALILGNMDLLVKPVKGFYQIRDNFSENAIFPNLTLKSLS